MDAKVTRRRICRSIGNPWHQLTAEAAWWGLGRFDLAIPEGILIRFEEAAERLNRRRHRSGKAGGLLGANTARSKASLSLLFSGWNFATLSCNWVGRRPMETRLNSRPFQTQRFRGLNLEAGSNRRSTADRSGIWTGRGEGPLIAMKLR